MASRVWKHMVIIGRHGTDDSVIIDRTMKVRPSLWRGRRRPPASGHGFEDVADFPDLPSTANDRNALLGGAIGWRTTRFDVTFHNPSWNVRHSRGACARRTRRSGKGADRRIPPAIAEKNTATHHNRDVHAIARHPSGSRNAHVSQEHKPHAQLHIVRHPRRLIHNTNHQAHEQFVVHHSSVHTRDELGGESAQTQSKST